MAEIVTHRSFGRRLVDAALLKPDLYEEVEADTSAMGQAMLVVALQGVAVGIGTSGLGLNALILAAVGSLLGWFVWAFLNYVIGAKFFPEKNTVADHGQLLRTMGFSAAPGLLRIFGILPVPYLWGILAIVANVWMFVAMVIAVRQALDYESTVRAMLVSVVGWLIQVVAFLALVMMIPERTGM